jgi:hypothetical protein
MIHRPYSKDVDNNVETAILTFHALITTLMTTLPFPLKSSQAVGMAGTSLNRSPPCARLLLFSSKL